MVGVENMCAVTDIERLKKIEQIDELCLRFDPKFMDVTHTFLNGVYTRTGRVKQGEVIIGAKHRVRSVFHLARGRVAVFDTVHGYRILTAPFSEITHPGTQRIGIALEDFEGSNILETDKTTVDEVEREMLFPFELPPLVGSKVMLLADSIQG